MKLHVDREADALYLRLDDSEIVESEVVLSRTGARLQTARRKSLASKCSAFHSGLRTSTSPPCSSKPYSKASPLPCRRSALMSLAEIEADLNTPAASF